MKTWVALMVAAMLPASWNGSTGTERRAENGTPVSVARLHSIGSERSLVRIPAYGYQDSLYDLVFLDMMIVHYDTAIAMAREAQTGATRSGVRDFARSVADRQQREVDQFRSWRSNWYQTTTRMDTSITAGRKDTSLANARAAWRLGSADTPRYDERFLDMMIVHHQAALTMVRDAAARAQHAELRNVAGQMVKDLEREIAQMQGMRRR